MRYKFFTKSYKALLAMFEDIKQAKKFIFLESFTLIDDELTHDFFNVLKEKAKNGVKVKIIIDRIADFWLSSSAKQELEKTGIEILSFHRWFSHTHRKILVVDNEISFIGGVNINGREARWLDLHLRLTGAMVPRLARSFSRMYQLAGGQDQAVLALRKTKNHFLKTRLALYKAKSWLIERWPKSQAVFRDYYKKKCREAQKKIVIATPYFIPHRWLIKSLRSAAKRGVKIEVIIPEKTDVWPLNLPHRLFAENLKDFMNFFFIPEMNHAKVLLVDDREGLIGSNNIDAQSFDFNLEASVVFQRKDMVGNLKHILELWKKMAMPLDQTKSYNKWYHKLAGLMVRLVQPIL